MIDLHLHTTASDGRLTPRELAARVRGIGFDTFSVTDHDTMAGVPEAEAAAREHGLTFVPGIEITAVYKAKDVHMLGYFLDWRAQELSEFLTGSREDRARRARVMGERLAALGVPIDIDALLAANGPTSGKSIARPVIARALLDAGHVATIQEAFDRYLAEGKPAYEARVGVSPADVVGVIHRAGGIAALAHPGPLGKDELIPSLVEHGLDAIEVYHSEHDEPAVARYTDLAHRYGVAVTGGSDYHGDGTRRAEFFGTVQLPRAAFEELRARARTRSSALAGSAPAAARASVQE